VKEKAAVALLALGLVQMTGDALGFPALKGLGMATAASPAPRVFSSIRGLETFSTRFYLEWRSRDGTLHSLALTPEVYERLRGAYNRRNAYGAALAAGPVLATDPRTQELFWAVFSHALCGEAPLLRELGIDPAQVDGPPRVRYEPLPGSSVPDLPTLLQPTCRGTT
jgi:hypothetical protein